MHSKPRHAVITLLLFGSDKQISVALDIVIDIDWDFEHSHINVAVEFRRHGMWNRLQLETKLINLPFAHNQHFVMFSSQSAVNCIAMHGAEKQKHVEYFEIVWSIRFQKSIKINFTWMQIDVSVGFALRFVWLHIPYSMRWLNLWMTTQI